MIRSKYTWKIKQTDEKQVVALAEELAIPVPLANMLWKRKITTAGQYDKFFHPAKYDVYDPFLLPEMDKAVTRIKKAIAGGERILIYGDYDADGVTSIAVLYKTLIKLGAEPSFYIPNRFTEGYGPNSAAFQAAKADGVDLLITVDNGIAALDVMEEAAAIGLDVIVTDHHEGRDTLPQAVAVIHPRHPESDYPFPDLAGVGVAYKLAHALLGAEPTELLDLVAVGTIADLVSLTDENRLLVQRGLRKLREEPTLGLAALAKKASVKLEAATEETVGFALAPRLNAIGRLGPADPAADLLLTPDEEEAGFLAEEIDEANKERKAIVAAITEEAVTLVEENGLALDRVLILSKEGWNAGVLGIVASRLVDRYARPVIMLASDPATGIAKGSGRSIPAFHLYQELDKNRALMIAFGGHPMAAGLTIATEQVEELRSQLNQQAALLKDEDFQLELIVEDKLALADIDVAFISTMENLAPFGTDNPKPIFRLQNLKLQNTKRIGGDKTHLKTLLVDENNTSATLDAVGFGFGDLAEKVSAQATVEIAGELSINEWNNVRKPQLRLVDMHIEKWQLFDVRNKTDWQQLIKQQVADRMIICFQPETADKLSSELNNKEVIAAKDLAGVTSEGACEELIFADLPAEAEQVTSLVNKIKPARIYIHFSDSEEIAAIPDRSAFAKLYSLIKKFQPFSLEKYIPHLSKQFGWTTAQINFMSNVFFDLNFVTMNDGVILLNEVKEKRNLEDSTVYQAKANKLVVKQKLLYANYQELHDWIAKSMDF